MYTISWFVNRCWQRLVEKGVFPAPLTDMLTLLVQGRMGYASEMAAW